MRLKPMLSLLPALGLPLAASAQIQATTTSLTLSSVSSVPAGTMETMTVQVFDSHNAVVPRGTVVFYDGKRIVGQSSILETGSGPIGSAVLKTRLGIGPHMLHAMYWGLSGSYARSTSAIQSLDVTGKFPLTLSLSASPTGNSNTLSVTAQAIGGVIPGGTVTFIDTSNGNAVLGTAALNPGGATIGFTQSAQINSPNAIADVNGDGFVDVVTPQGTYYGKGDGTFTLVNVPVNTYSATPTDFNRDGLADFLAITSPPAPKNLSATGSVYLGDGTGSFRLTATNTQNSSLYVTGYSVAAGDLNNDGIPDVLGLFSPIPYEFLGEADGTLAASSAPVQSAYFSSYGAPILVDLNGDGNLDVVNLNTNIRQISIALGNGDGSTQPAMVFQPGNILTGIAVDDMNQDGVPDLIVAAYTAMPTGGFRGPLVEIALGKGDGTFGPFSFSAPYSQSDSHNVATGDVNGDGFPDVLLNGYLLYPGKGDGTVGPPVTTFNTGGEATKLVDVNGDGLADVVAGYEVDLSTSGSSAFANLSNVVVSGQHQVVAVYSGSGNFPAVQSAPVTISGAVTPGGGGVDAGTGFSPTLGLNLNGSAKLVGTALQLTDGGGYEAASAWSAAPVKTTSFTSDFHFQVTGGEADGFTFAIQNSVPTSLGSFGGELGYNFVPNSVALKFDLYSNAGEGANTVGVYTAGNSLTGPGLVLPSNVSLLAGHTMLAHVTYDGYTLNLLLTDTSTGASATYRKVIDIAGAIGSNTAYVGFTGGTGALSSTIQILDWSYKPGTVSIDSAARFENVGLSLNGTANIQDGTVLNMTQNVQTVPTAQYKAASAWTPSPFDITSFHSTFTFTNNSLGNAPADGFTFTLQRSDASAIGSAGGELGFNFIPNSVALKFDFFDNNGEGANTTGLYPAGVSLTDPTYSVPTSVNILNAVNVKADIAYDGTTLTLVLTDPQSGATSTWSKVVNLPAMLGGSTAFYGFTAGTGQLTTALSIESWKLVVGSAQ
ncbi:FG-GAP-like repeat-containing protein [Terriglobus roseus]|uniref:Repeat domain-containing protein n=1 Tax=Terriglobus roseus TaxID=392734 RepID=A0A1H4Q6B6_9BACT|nr:FG-GAP-like repeat-containing protein [Terriglobus roseus]SEC15164.1 Repeat domain-containing protein [Terriglobus roseus]